MNDTLLLVSIRAIREIRGTSFFSFFLCVRRASAVHLILSRLGCLAHGLIETLNVVLVPSPGAESHPQWPPISSMRFCMLSRP
jgi:hypothetical protein